MPSTSSAPVESTPPPVDAASAAPLAEKEPSQSDYSNDAEGLEQFLNDRDAWRQKHAKQEPEGESQPEERSATESVEPEKEQRQETPREKDAASPTPQKIDEWSAKDPGFRAALEANPQLKGELFALARMNEKAKPVLELLPTLEEAKFAVENANTLVQLRTGLMLAVEDPERLPETFDKLQDLFRVKDANGEYLRDEQGNYKLADDYALLRNQFVDDGLRGTLTPLKQKMEQLRERLANGVYPSQAARSLDENAYQESEYAVAALEYAQAILNGETGDAALPELPDDATPAQREFQERLRRQAEEQARARQTNTKEQRLQQRQQYRNKLLTNWNSGIGKALDEAVASERSSGGYIPDFILQEKWINPQTGQPTNVSNFAMQVKLDFDRRVLGMPGVRQKLAELEMLPPGPESEAAAAAYQQELRAAYLPDVVQSHLRRIQDGLLQGQRQRQERLAEIGRVASVEPRSGSTPQPQSLTPAQINAKAAETARNLPGYSSMTAEERLDAELRERYKLRGLAG